LLGAAVIFTCAPMAIALAITSLAIAKLASRAMLAESFTWNATCLLTGISAGIAAGGVLVEVYSTWHHPSFPDTNLSFCKLSRTRPG